MMNISENKTDKNKKMEEVCSFLEVDNNINFSDSLENFIKEACVKKLCEIVGLTWKFNHRSDFFEFFSQIMGEAINLKLNLKTNIACDSLRLFKYEGVNLIERTVFYLETECLEEAFLDTFELADKFKYLIEKIDI